MYYGWGIVAVASVIGSIGAAAVMFALEGQIFGLRGWGRFRYAVCGFGLCGFAFWIACQWAEPLINFERLAS